MDRRDRTITFTICLAPDLFDELEDRRGDIKRSTYIAVMLKNHFRELRIKNEAKELGQKVQETLNQGK